MTTQRLPRLLLATAAGVLACGLPLWPLSYREVSIGANPPPSLWLLLSGAAGLLAGILLRPGLLRPILAVTLGFMIAVMGRVEVETSRDSTSHNLWPIEVVMAGAIGLAAAAIGVGAARLGQRAADRRAA